MARGAEGMVFRSDALAALEDTREKATSGATIEEARLGKRVGRGRWKLPRETRDAAVAVSSSVPRKYTDEMLV